MAVLQVKRCCTCKQDKSLSAFGPYRRSNDGLKHRCRECCHAEQREYRERNKEACAMRIKSWTERNQERCKVLKHDNHARRQLEAPYREQRRTKSCLYRLKNPGAGREKRRAWQKAHPEKVASYRARCYRRNKDKRREYVRRNIEKYRAWWAHKRAKRRGLPMDWGRRDMASALRYFRHCCPVCRTAFTVGSPVQWDHWVPVASDNCPGTIPQNMVPLCGTCNRSKRNHEAAKWLAKKLGEGAQQVLLEIEYFLACARPAKCRE